MTLLNSKELLEGTTPGPWRAEARSILSPWTDSVEIMADEGGIEIWLASTTRGFEGDGSDCNSQALANARLIAEAPHLARRVIELERALREIAEIGKGCELNWGDAQDAIDIARAALNGEQTA